MTTRKKRGRPRITGKLREPNGRISRAKNPRIGPFQHTIEMRAKHFGLTIEEAKNPLSSSYIGRLCLLGYKQDALSISKEQYDTAQRYLQIRNDYLCAKGLPNGYYDDFMHASDEKAQKQWLQKATNHYEDMKEVIKEAQHLHRQHNFHAALQYLVVEDQSLPYLVCSLRIILNALRKHFEGSTKE
ncbi:hypothetical protein HWV54_02990 [Bartonella alsatica]|uniref:Uncharacterized protein n=2 Tax=Bartonella alsatica TaxID=52764 RepID=J0PPA4_9HYPH|nr:hypothetical protein [Bartonella alsatica]EJF74306.1 hypothetical protein MEC_01316 [Bartonella alsatica IBS 382]QLC51880.1 hypothetical protein HWV54_02990 [Bartonella alsatica]